MAPKHYPNPLSGSDRKAMKKELVRARAMTKILAERSAEQRAAGEALTREADDLLCQNWNERMWSDGGPADPSPTIDQAIHGGYGWLDIRCSRCRTPRSVDLCQLPHVATTCCSSRVAHHPPEISGEGQAAAVSLDWRYKHCITVQDCCCNSEAAIGPTLNSRFFRHADRPSILDC